MADIWQTFAFFMSYYYYVLDPEAGVHQFSKTLAEHEKKIKQIYG